MFDDHAVFQCDDDMICVPEGYLLFYRRIKDYKKLKENTKKNIYFDFYKNKGKDENEKEDDKIKEDKLNKDIKEGEEESEGEENEEDEEQ